MNVRHGHTLMDAVISEMDSNVSDDLVPVDKSVIENVKAGDDSPLFITMQVLAEGVSKNGRHYTPEMIQRVADAVNSKRPYGYQGHLTKEERKTKAPDPLVMWLGASTKEENGKTVMYARGYVYPYATKFKTQLQKAKAVGKNLAMSIQGTAKKAIWNTRVKGYDLQDFVLDTIDFARDGKEGVPNNGTLILASEMHDEDNNNPKKGNKPMFETKADALKEITVADIRENAKHLVSEIVEAESGELVSEMESVTELIGADDKKSTSELVSEMVTENTSLKEQLASAELKAELAGKVKASGARPVIEQLVVSEMADAEGEVDVSEMIDNVLASEEGKGVMAQFTSTEPKIAAGHVKPEAKANRSFTTKRFK